MTPVLAHQRGLGLQLRQLVAWLEVLKLLKVRTLLEVLDFFESIELFDAWLRITN